MRASRIVCFALAGVVGSFVSAHAALLGVAPGFPALAYDNSGVMTYDSATDLFIVDAFPLAIRFTPIAQPVLVVPTGNPAMERVFIQIHVDESGAFSGGVAVADLVVIGQVDQNGDSIPEFSGVLLTGEAVAFGFQETSGATGIFDFRFAVTGGAMASEFGGGAIGVTLASENSNFPGDFTRSFAGFAKGNIGPIAFRCGDDFVDGGEQCDDGANNSDTAPNACRTDCTRAGCGDGVVDAGEQCDDGAGNSDTEPNACRIDCTRPSCDDGVVDAGEQCDDGTNNSDTAPNACRADCTRAGCGDGVVDAGEQCDDGTDNSDTEPNACRTDCARAGCGDGVIDAGEQCDDGNADNNDACSNNCTTGCGNGIVNTGEQCDDGTNNSDTAPNACRTDCTRPACGDGVIDAGEQCDDGAGNSDTEPNACRIDCTRPSCGDGVIDAGEQCDDGNTNDNDACTNACTTAVCGDGIVQTGVEQCDDGTNNSDTAPNACRTDCTRAACGDGVIDAGEQCDDGNTNDNDACSNNCTTGCGNGIVNTGEQCDGASDAACPGECDNSSCKCIPTCELNVVKTCEVPAPAYVCTKPIQSLTMKWNGSESIRIAGTAGVTPFDIDNIAVGGVVTVSGYNGSTNDVIWNIYKAGAGGAVLGRSDFHLSCSDSDMNDPTDCGKAEGDAKGLLGFINTWIFGGMAGSGATLVCPGIDPGTAGATTCAIVVPPYVCTKPIVSLTMEWNGTEPIRIAGTAGVTPFDIDNIAVGGVVTVSGYNGSPNDVIWNIYKAGTSTVLGRSDFHLSCSDSDMNGPEDCDKAEGDAKGLLGFINTWIFNGMSGGGKTLDCNNPGGGSTSPVTYRYVVTNKTSNPVTGVNLTDEITDSSGTFTVPIAGPFDLAPNETKNFSSVDDIGTDTTDVATASNDICSASSEIVTVTVGGGPGPVPGCATGADALVLRGKEVSWLLTNSTASRLQISKITISWPGANGFLDQVKLHKDKISDGNFNPPTVEITRFKGKKGDRTIDKNKAEALRFVFQNAAASGPYTITVEFSNGCSVSKAIP